MQVGLHALGRLVGDLEACLQHPRGDGPHLRTGYGLRGVGAQEEAEVGMDGGLAHLLQLLLEPVQPALGQMDVLRKEMKVRGDI